MEMSLAGSAVVKMVVLEVFWMGLETGHVIMMRTVWHVMLSLRTVEWKRGVSILMLLYSD